MQADFQHNLIFLISALVDIRIFIPNRYVAVPSDSGVDKNNN